MRKGYLNDMKKGEKHDPKKSVKLNLIQETSIGKEHPRRQEKSNQRNS